jgi:hypothetical protein
MEFILVLYYQFGKTSWTIRNNLGPNWYFLKTMNAEKLFDDVFLSVQLAHQYCFSNWVLLVSCVVAHRSFWMAERVRNGLPYFFIERRILGSQPTVEICTHTDNGSFKVRTPINYQSLELVR